MGKDKKKVYCGTCIWMTDLGELGIHCVPPTGETFSNYYAPNNMICAKSMYCSKRNKNNDCIYYTEGRL